MTTIPYKELSYNIKRDTLRKEFYENENFKTLIKLAGEFVAKNLYTILEPLSKKVDIQNFIDTILVDGYIAFERIRNEDEVVAYKILDPITLVPEINRNGRKQWVQFPTDEKMKRILFPDQIIYISCQELFASEFVSFADLLYQEQNSDVDFKDPYLMNLITELPKILLPNFGHLFLNKQTAQNVVEMTYTNPADFKSTKHLVPEELYKLTKELKEYSHNRFNQSPDTILVNEDGSKLLFAIKVLNNKIGKESDSNMYRVTIEKI